MPTKPLRGSNIGHLGIRTMVMAHGVRLTWLQRTVLVAIGSHANERGECYPSLALLAAETDLSVQSVLAAVRQLVRLGVLSKHRRGFNRSNAYILDADALAGLPRIAVTADAEDGEGLKAGDISGLKAGDISGLKAGSTSGLKAGTGGSESTPGTGVKVHRHLTVQKNGSEERNKEGRTPPTPPRRGGARVITADDSLSGGRTVETAGGNGHRGHPGGTEDPRRWLDRYNLRMETDLPANDPANLRAIRRTIAKGYTVADADRVLTWVAATWRDAPRLLNTIFGQNFGQYFAEAKRPKRGAAHDNAKWGEARPTLSARDDA